MITSLLGWIWRICWISAVILLVVMLVRKIKGRLERVP